MSYTEIGKEVIKRGGQELENISLNIHFPNIKFHILIENSYTEEIKSNISYLDSSVLILGNLEK